MPVSRSKAPPPQFAPPMIPGRMMVPLYEGGVKIGPSLYFFISAWAAAFNSGVASKASSSVTPCGVNDGGSVGNGWVAAVCSPATSNRPLFDRPNGPAGNAVENKRHALLGELNNHIRFSSMQVQLGEDGRRRQIIIPEPVVNDLKVPLANASRC